MTYKPKPVDTSKTIVDKKILMLTELLAKNAHEVWAEQRIRDGWKYGTERNDLNKEHPCLVPYEDLTESEKEYDRKAAVETIKVMIELGYMIVRDETK